MFVVSYRDIGNTNREQQYGKREKILEECKCHSALTETELQLMWL